MRWSESKFLIGLVVAFILILGCSAAAYFSTVTNIRSSQTLEQSIQFTGGMEGLYTLVKRLDTNARLFVKTGSRKALATYKTDRNAITPTVADTKEAYHINQRRVSALESLERWIATVVNDDEVMVRARDDDDLDRAREFLNHPNAPIALRSMRTQIDQVEDEERSRLHAQIMEYDASTRRAINTYLMLSFLVMLLMLLIGGSTYRYIAITRKEMEADRRVAKEIVEHAPIGILRLSNDLTVTEVNPIYCQYVGKKPEDLVNRKVTDILKELPKTAFLEAVEKGEAHQVGELFLRLDENDVESERYWDITLWPIRELNIVKGMILLVVDVTEKVNLSNQREVFAQTLTHDMKTPLIAADRIYEAILDSRVGSVDKGQYEILEKLRKNNQDVLKMVKDVLEVSRYKQHNLVLNPDILDIKAIIADCLSKMAGTAEHRHIKLVSTLPEHLPYAFADKVATQHLILNLVENAIKFSQMEGSVELTAAHTDTSVIVNVKDSGPGMTAEEQKKLFKSSWQGELGKTAPSGTGLGLYLCHQIVRANRGEISCQSVYGEGTTFTISLPLAPSAVRSLQHEEDAVDAGDADEKPKNDAKIETASQPVT